MEWTASEILEELKKNLQNEDSRIEGSFTMDNLQAVSEVLAMYNGMLIQPLWDEIDKQIEQVVTSGNENHYVYWAKQVQDSSGKKVIGNARAYGVRDGSGVVYVALITPEATAPSEETIHLVEEYIKTQRPVGAKPIISAAEAMEVTVQGVVELQDGVEIGVIQTQAQKAVSEYMADCDINDHHNLEPGVDDCGHRVESGPDTLDIPDLNTYETDANGRKVIVAGQPNHNLDQDPEHGPGVK